MATYAQALSHAALDATTLQVQSTWCHAGKRRALFGMWGPAQDGGVASIRGPAPGDVRSDPSLKATEMMAVHEPLPAFRALIHGDVGVCTSD